MKQEQLRKMILCALCVALCVVLPLAFHGIPNAGVVLCPMHIPVLLCGLIAGWQYGAVCGLLGPLVSAVLTGMPPAAVLPSMMVELTVYYLVAGLLMKLVHTGKLVLDIYISLGTALIAGRVLAGIAKALFFAPGTYTMQAWVTASFITAFPGIVLQLLLVPGIVYTLAKAKLIPEETEKRCYSGNSGRRCN